MVGRRADDDRNREEAADHRARPGVDAGAVIVSYAGRSCVCSLRSEEVRDFTHFFFGSFDSSTSMAFSSCWSRPAASSAGSGTTR